MEIKYMKFTQNTNKETVKILLNENKRLKCENQRLRESIEDLQRYKDEYKMLINELNSIKDSYLKKINNFKKIERDYYIELDKIKKSKKG